MELALLVLYSLGGASELSGLLVTFIGLFHERKRLRAYLGRPIDLDLHDAAHAAESETVRVEREPPPPIEERVAALESQLDAVRRDLNAREQRITQTIQQRMEKRIRNTAKRLRDVLKQLEDYVLDDRKLLQSKIFIGPVLLGNRAHPRRGWQRAERVASVKP